MASLRLGVLAIVVIAVPGPSRADGDKWAGWTASWENDSFVLGRGTDDLYTNGVRFALGRASGRNFKYVKPFGEWWRRKSLPRLLGRSGKIHDVTSALVFGQNLFTPTEITDFEVDPADRPYAGLLYAGIRMDVTEQGRERPTELQLRFQHSIDVNLGVLGPVAGAGEIQSAVHVLRNSRIPKGWPHQLPNEPALFANLSTRARIGYHFADVVPQLGVMLGTPQTYAYGGGVARLGFNMSGFPAQVLRQTATPAADRPDWEAGVFVGVEGRAFARNAYVDGTLLRESASVPSRHLVADHYWPFGFTARLTDWRLTYTALRRTPEMRRNGAFGGVDHKFGSLSFSYEPGRRTRLDREGTFVGWLADRFLAAVFDDLLVEASVGKGVSSGEGSGAQDGMAMHVALGRRFGRRFAVAGELTGIVREGDRPASTSSDHLDTFFVNRVLTARVAPFAAGRGPGAWHVRAGIGSALGKVEVTPGDPGPRPGPCPPGLEPEGSRMRSCASRETGLGLLVGTGYGLALSKQASLNADVAWNRLGLDRSRKFLVWSLGVGWHP